MNKEMLRITYRFYSFFNSTYIYKNLIYIHCIYTKSIHNYLSSQRQLETNFKGYSLVQFTFKSLF